MKKTININNPLTLIGIFAALTEAVCAVVMPYLNDPDIQNVFLIFVIGFPTLVVILFFLTLNFNKCALYAPSDYPPDIELLKEIYNKKKTIIKKKIGTKKDFDVFIDSVDFSEIDTHLKQYLEFVKVFITKVRSNLSLEKLDEFLFDCINQSFYLLEIRISASHLNEKGKRRHIFILNVIRRRDYDFKKNEYTSDYYTFGIITGSGYGKTRENSESLADYVISSIKKEIKINST